MDIFFSFPIFLWWFSSHLLTDSSFVVCKSRIISTNLSATIEKKSHCCDSSFTHKGGKKRKEAALNNVTMGQKEEGERGPLMKKNTLKKAGGRSKNVNIQSHQNQFLCLFSWGRRKRDRKNWKRSSSTSSLSHTPEIVPNFLWFRFPSVVCLWLLPPLKLISITIVHRRPTNSPGHTVSNFFMHGKSAEKWLNHKSFAGNCTTFLVLSVFFHAFPLLFCFFFSLYSFSVPVVDNQRPVSTFVLV